jgi:predicted nucleic acid-binding protein
MTFMKGRCFFDTNILVYAFNNDPSENKKSQTGQDLILEALDHDTMVLSPQVLGELHVTLTRKAKPALSTNDSQKIIQKLCDAEVVDITKQLVASAIELSKNHQLSYWNALIVVSAQSANCKTVYSEDLQHEQKFEDLQIINPFA